MRRKKFIEPEINQEEIANLRALLEKEEELEADMKRELREVIKTRDKKLMREFSRLENKNRRLIMWVGVIVLMLAIISFWVSRLDVIITRPLATDKTQDFDLSEASTNMQTTAQEVIKSIDEIKKQAQLLEAGSSTSSQPIKTLPKLP